MASLMASTFVSVEDRECFMDFSFLPLPYPGAAMERGQMFVESGVTKPGNLESSLICHRGSLQGYKIIK